MNLSKQIKKHRDRLNLSQEELAEKLFVSRQTISNWENERSYPDVHNLLLLSVLFNVSLDELVKGDVEEMNKQISNMNMDKYSKMMVGFLILTALSVGAALFLPDYWWILPPLIFWSIAMYAAIQLERIKKKENIKTYKEIVAFMENKDLDSLRDKRNSKKDLLSKTLIVLLVVIIFSIITLIFCIPYFLLHK